MRVPARLTSEDCIATKRVIMLAQAAVLNSARVTQLKADHTDFHIWQTIKTIANCAIKTKRRDSMVPCSLLRHGVSISNLIKAFTFNSLANYIALLIKYSKLI